MWLHICMEVCGQDSMKCMHMISRDRDHWCIGSLGIVNCVICICIIGGNDDKARCIFILDVLWRLHFDYLCVWQFSAHWWRMMGSFLTASNACAVLTMLRWIGVVTINTTLRINARKSTSGRLMTDDWWTQEVPPHKVPPSRTFWGGTSWG